MSNYFSYFPTIEHDLTNVGQTVTLTNILRRFIVKPEVSERVGIYHEYSIQAGDRADTIAAKYYGSSNHAWIVIHFNNIVDPQWKWPLFNDDFNQYIRGKYGSIPAAQSQVHEYRQILNEATVKNDGTRIEKRTLVVDLTTYNTLAAASRETITKYDYEEELQEKYRKIKILDKRYLSQIRDEVKSILRNSV